MRTRISLILSVIFLAFFPVNGQKIAFKNYTIKEGLPQSTVICIIQDSKGYIWMGTQAGLVRFDGKNFVTYTTELGLADNTINCLLEDHTGRLWIGTNQGGISVYDGLRFRNYNREKDGLIANEIVQFFEDSKKNIWVRTHFGLSIISSGKIKSFDDKKGLPHNNALCISEDRKGNIWCGTQQGIAVFRDRQIVSTYLDQINNEPGLLDKKATVWAIHEDQQGLIWIATQGGGVITFDGTSFKKYGEKNGLASGTVISMFEDSRHNLWFGTYGKGISWWDGKAFKTLVSPELQDVFFMKFAEDKLGNIWSQSRSNGVFKFRDGKFYHYLTDNSLANNVLWDIYIDQEGNVWLATSGGVSIYGKGIFELYSIENGLPDNNISSVFADKKGNVWFGAGYSLVKFNKNGLSVYGKQQGFKFDRGEQKQVLSLFSDSRANLWVGTYSNLFHYIGGRFERLGIDLCKNLYKNDNGIYNISEDSKGNLWLATDHGLFKYDGRKMYQYTVDSGMVDDKLNAILFDNEKNLWIAAQSGLSIYNGKKFTNYTLKNGLPAVPCTGLMKDNNSNVWVATEGGVCRFSRNKDGSFQIKAFTTKDGLASNNIYLLETDNQGYLWIGHNKGLNRLNLATEKIDYYGPQEGFIPIETNQNAVSRDPDGNLWFGTQTGGLVKYIPENNWENKLPPKTYITSLKFIGRGESVEKYAQGIDSVSHLPKKLKLPFNRNFVTFDYIGISLTIPDKVRYQYKLEGYDEQWSEIKNETTAQYKKLPNGKFTFLVRAYNNDGITTSEPVAFSFEIKPPFWKTIWFILLEIATAVFLVIQVIRYRERQLQHDKKVLEQKVEERTAQIQKQKKVIEDKNDELVAQQHEILAQRDEIQRQRDIAEEQRDQISFQKKEITDSIHYAKRIQNAILTSEEDSKRILGDHFILFKPRDIVSGDFYWMTRRDNKVVVTAADCTGHGVPGAFMSMLGVSFLNEIVNKEGIFHANEILNKLRDYVKTTLSQTGKEHEAKDGMDIGLCVIDFNTNQVEFAGANNPLYVVRNNALIEFKGDNMPIGIHAGEERLFKNYVFEMQKKDMLYLFSDGYSDQFGGPDGGKFKIKPFKRLFVEINDRPLFQQWILLEETIEKWQGELDQVDDILVIGIRI